jgi:RecA-family ATPase
MRSDKATCAIYQRALKERALDYYRQYVSLDDLESRVQMRDHFEKAIRDVLVRKVYTDEIAKVIHAVEISTAWRVEGTLREFAKFKPVNMWFSYPVHYVDTSGVLADIQLDDNKPNWQKNLDKGPKAKKESAKDKQEKLMNAIQILDDGLEPVTIDAVVEYFSTEEKPISEKTIRRWLKNTGQFEVEKGQILPVNNS